MKNSKGSIIVLALAAFLVGIVGTAHAETFRQGGLRYSFNESASTTKTAAYTITTSDSLVNVDATSAAITITLPTTAAAKVGGTHSFKVVKTDATANSVTVTPATGDTIGGESTRVLTYENAYMIIRPSTNNDWVVDFESPYVVEDYESGTLTIYGTQTLQGDQTVSGTTPTLTIGDGGAEDGAIIFDTDAPAANSFHAGYDDSADMLRIGVGEALGTDMRLSIGNSTTATNIVVGDAAAEDIQFTFDGNAQDFHVGLDDSADDLVIGVGSALGTTPAISIDENRVVTINASIIYPVEDVTAANVIAATECGKTFLLNSTTEFASTLPTVSTVTSGCTFSFIVKAAPSGANYTIITGNSLENVMQGSVYNGAGVDTQAAADTITLVASASVIGDRVDIISDGTWYYVHGNSGSDTGITIAQAD
jgi:hypothetical protein